VGGRAKSGSKAFGDYFVVSQRQQELNSSETSCQKIVNKLVKILKRVGEGEGEGGGEEGDL
jgi:hypothetical protein